jgi:hypothetical protein
VCGRIQLCCEKFGEKAKISCGELLIIQKNI